MKFLSILLTALTLMFSGVGVAHADPITSALFGAAFAASWAGTIVTQLLISVSLSALSAAIMPKQKLGKAGITTEYTQTGGDNPLSMTLGTYMTAGTHVCPPMTFGFSGDGSGAEWMVNVISLGDVPITSLEQVVIDGTPYNLIPYNPNESYFEGKQFQGYSVDGKLNHKCVIRFHDGNQTTSDDILTQYFSNYPERPWSSNHILTGTPYAVVFYKHDPEKFPGLPDAKFVIKGMELYDPRKDSTVGGSGTHRWNDKSTWEYTDNPVVQIYNVIRGIPLPGGLNYGIGAPASSFQLAKWFSMMNRCDALVDGEKRYRSSIEITLDTEPLEVIETLLAACGGSISEYGGYYNIIVAAPAAPAASFNDDEVIITESRDSNIFEGLQQTFNGVTASYPDPTALWETKEAVPYHNATWEAQDEGRRLVADLKLPAVPYPKQVRRLMRELAADNRRTRKHSVTLPPAYLGVNVLDSISWTSPINGYDGKLFEVISKTVDPFTLCVTFGLRERDPSDYDYDGNFDGTLPVYPSVTPVVITPVGVYGFSANAMLLQDAQGRPRRAAIQISWNPEVIFQSIAYEIRNTTTQQVVAKATTSNVRDGAVIVAEGIIPSTAYEVRIKGIIPNRETQWSGWLAVTTGAATITNDDFSEGVAKLFRDQGMYAIEYLATLPTTGSFNGQLVFNTTNGKLYRWVTSPAPAKWVAVVENAIQGVLDETSFATGISIPRVVSSLPTTGNFEGRIVTLTTNGKLYRYVGGAWTSAVPAVDVTGQLTNTQIADIDAAKLTGQITGPQIADSAIGAAKIANNAITSIKLLDGAITELKLANNAVSAVKIATGAVLTDKLANNAITEIKISDGAISGVKIAAESITETKIANNAITTPKIVAGAVTANTIAANAITSSKIEAGAVTANAIAANAITAGKIAANTITSAEIAAGAITASEIAAGAITTVKIAAGAVTANTIAAGAVTANTIAAGAVTANAIAANAITAGKIAANTITSAEIAAGSITASEIAANTITSAKIATGAITSEKITAGAIGADQIAANAIVASKLAIADFTNLVPDDQIQDQGSWITTTNGGWSHQPTTPRGDIRSVGDWLYISANHTASGDSVCYTRGFFPVTPGDVLYLSVQMIRSGGTKMRALCQIVYHDKNDAVIAGGYITFASVNGTTNTANDYVGEHTVPAGAMQARLRFYVYKADTDSNVYFASPTVRIKNKGELIVDGAITATKIGVGAVTANSIAANAITAVKIDAGAITTAKLAAGAVTANTIAANAITAGKIAAGAVEANTIAANAITSDKIDANAITAAKIAAGAIGADQIAAGSIVASKLAITDFTNLVPDDQIQDKSAWVYTSSNNIIVHQATTAANNIKSVGSFRYTYANNTSRADAYTYTRGFFPVTPGDVLYLSGQMIRVGGTRMYARMDIIYYDKNDVALTSNSTYTFASYNGTANQGTYTGEHIVPAGAYQARFRFLVYGLTTETDGDIQFGSPTVRLKNKGELIVDGTITGDKIVAQTIHGGLIAAAGVITNAAQINNGVITNAKIANAEITYLKLAGKTLFVPRYWTRADYTLNDATNQSNPVTLFNVNIPEFEAGGCIIEFKGIVDSNINYDSFGRFEIVVDNVVRNSVSAGVRTSGGNTGGWIPVSLSFALYGNATTNVKIRGWSHGSGDLTGNVSKNDVVIRSMSLTVSGSRR